MVTHPVSGFKERRNASGLQRLRRNELGTLLQPEGDPVAWEFWYELKWIKSMLPAFSHETVQIDHWTHTRNIDATKKCYHIFTLPYAICEFLETKCPSQTVKTLPIYGVIHLHPASPLALDSLDAARRVMLLKGLPKGLMCPGVTQQLASQTQFSARKLEPSRQRGETRLWKVYDTNHPTSNMENRHWKLHMAKFHGCHLYPAKLLPS